MIFPSGNFSAFRICSNSSSVNMTLFERTREFGTLLALGDRPGTVFRLIMTESALLDPDRAITKAVDAACPNTVVDGRNIFKPEEIRAAGFTYHSVGRD